MLARSGPLPSGDYSYELKWDGFRAIVGRNDLFRVRSRRGRDMTALLPELADLPVDGVFDGELVGFADGKPHFPLVCERLLHRARRVSLTFVIFDVLEIEHEPTLDWPYARRRGLLEELKLREGPWFVPDVYDDGAALFAGVCEQGLEGVVAKRRGERHRPGERRWIKTKNRDYWRYGEELESLRMSLDRRRRVATSRPSVQRMGSGAGDRRRIGRATRSLARPAKRSKPDLNRSSPEAAVW
jgi:bifunctional non-homologous end joining protein LigD